MKPKKRKVCEWFWEYGFGHWITSCHEYDFDDRLHVMHWFTYCPYCGKEIKVKG